MKSTTTANATPAIILANVVVKLIIDAGRIFSTAGIRLIENTANAVAEIVPKITTISPNVNFFHPDRLTQLTIPVSA